MSAVAVRWQAYVHGGRQAVAGRTAGDARRKRLAGENRHAALHIESEVALRR